MRDVIWSRDSQRDFDRAIDYLMNAHPEWLDSLAIETETAVSFIAGNSGAGAPIDDGVTREWRIGKTPYVLLYRFDRRQVRIGRVVHDRSDWVSTL